MVGAVGGKTREGGRPVSQPPSNTRVRLLDAFLRVLSGLLGLVNGTIGLVDCALHGVIDHIAETTTNNGTEGSEGTWHLTNDGRQRAVVAATSATLAFTASMPVYWSMLTFSSCALMASSST